MTLDERLQGAAQEVLDQFESLEAPRLAEPVTRTRSRIRSGSAVAALAFLAVLVVGATLLWLGPFGGAPPPMAEPAGVAAAMGRPMSPRQRLLARTLLEE